MNQKAGNIIRLLNEYRPKFIVETGTIRNTGEGYETGDGHSTKYIAEWVKVNGGVFYSIDLKTNVCRDYLTRLGLAKYVNLITGNSLSELPKIPRIDFAYLDSENDADLILKEFLIVWPRITTRTVMVDDCSMESRELMKGKKLIPYLNERNINYELTGHQLIVRK